MDENSTQHQNSTTEAVEAIDAMMTQVQSLKETPEGNIKAEISFGIENDLNLDNVDNFYVVNTNEGKYSKLYIHKFGKNTLQ